MTSDPSMDPPPNGPMPTSPAASGPTPTDPAMAERIVAAAAEGAFAAAGLSAGSQLSGVAPLGWGESYAAWRLDRDDGEPLVLRIVRRPPAELPRPMAQEFAALRLVPHGVGTQGRAMGDSGDNALGRPWMLTSYVPGDVKDGPAWKADDVAAAADTIAALHLATATRSRGPVGEEVVAPFDLLDEFEAGWSWWTGAHHEVTTPADVRDLHRRVGDFLRERADAFARLDGYALVHADLVATNVVLDGGVARFIDWEWAEYGDPARDLAFLGGTVHAGPWYVPLDDAGVGRLVESYAEAVARRGGHVDAADLRIRRDCWEVQERLLTSLHFAKEAAKPGAAARYAPAVRLLRETLDGRLDRG